MIATDIDFWPVQQRAGFSQRRDAGFSSAKIIKSVGLFTGNLLKAGKTWPVHPSASDNRRWRFA
jgi:hypothetical protein